MATALLSRLIASAPAAPPGGNPPSPDLHWFEVLNETIKDRLDLLNHPGEFMTVLLQVNLVWAAIFTIVGAACIMNGYRWRKPVIITLAGLAGVWAGVTIGSRVGDVTIVAVCLALLAAILAWPLLKYSVALFGGLAGAFAGANIWTAIGADPQIHYVGALIGLIVIGMLAFMAFRPVVIILTTIGGTSLLISGVLAAMLHVDRWRNGLLEGMQNKPLLLPLIAAVAAAIGAVIQFSGGIKGLNQLADSADAKGGKEKKAA